KTMPAKTSRSTENVFQTMSARKTAMIAMRMARAAGESLVIPWVLSGAAVEPNGCRDGRCAALERKPALRPCVPSEIARAAGASVGREDDAVVAPGAVRRDEAAAQIALYRFDGPLLGAAVTAAAAGLDDNEVIGMERETVALIGIDTCAIAHHRDAAGCARSAAAHAPRRAAGAVEIGAQRAWGENAVMLDEAEPAAKAPGPAGIGPQRQPLIAVGIERLLQLHRNDARIAMRHGAERAGAVMGGASAPTAMARIMAVEERAVGPAAGEADRGIGAEMRAGDALGQRRLERLDDGVDDGGEGRAVHSHRRGRLGADNLARRQHELQRTKRTLIGGLAGRDEIHEGDARSGNAAAVIARIDAALNLGRDVGIVDGHVVARDDDLDLDRNAHVAHAVIVEEGFRAVDAVGNPGDAGADRRLAAVENEIDRCAIGRDAEFLGEVSRQVAAQQAACELRLDIAHQLQRKARIVFDDAQYLLDRLAFRPDLDGAVLNAFHENIGRGIGGGADRGAADVDPVHIDREKADELARRAGIDRRIHHRVVEMLALDAGRIADDDVALVQPLGTVELQPVAHRAADGVGDEDRHAAIALRDQPAGLVRHADGIVLVFIDIGAEGGAGDIGVDLVGDRDDAVSDHFEGDGIDAGRGLSAIHAHRLSWLAPRPDMDANLAASADLKTIIRQDHGGRAIFFDDRRAFGREARSQRRAIEDRRLELPGGLAEIDLPRPPPAAAVARRCERPSVPRKPGNRREVQGLHLDLGALIGVTVAPAIVAVEGVAQTRGVAQRADRHLDVVALA